MIVSRSKRFVMAAMAKVASTSTHLLLEQFTQGKDDITSGWDDDHSEHAFHTPENMKNFPILSYDEYLKIAHRPIPFWPKTPDGSMDDISNPILKRWISPNGTIDINSQAGILSLLARQMPRHATPQEIINMGMLRENEMGDYDWYTIVRDPIDRAMSTCFFDASIHLKREPVLQDVVDWIDEQDPDTSIKVYMMRTTRDYVEYKGQKLCKVIKYNDFHKEMGKLINYYGGVVPDTFPSFKSYCRPSWSKEPVEEWLPQTSLDKLRLVLKDDIEHYNTL